MYIYIYTIHIHTYPYIRILWVTGKPNIISLKSLGKTHGSTEPHEDCPRTWHISEDNVVPPAAATKPADFDRWQNEVQPPKHMIFMWYYIYTCICICIWITCICICIWIWIWICICQYHTHTWCIMIRYWWLVTCNFQDHQGPLLSRIDVVNLSPCHSFSSQVKW